MLPQKFINTHGSDSNDSIRHLSSVFKSLAFCRKTDYFSALKFKDLLNSSIFVSHKCEDLASFFLSFYQTSDNSKLTVNVQCHGSPLRSLSLLAEHESTTSYPPAGPCSSLSTNSLPWVLILPRSRSQPCPPHTQSLRSHAGTGVCSSNSKALIKRRPDGPVIPHQHTNTFAKLINSKIDKSSAWLS